MITTSPDGQWAAVKRGREVVLLAGGAGPATSRVELPTEEADLVLVGPPSVLAVVTRGAAVDGAPCNRVVLYQPPYLDAVAGHELDAPMRIAGLTGSRIVLVSLDAKSVIIVRVAGRALAIQSVDPGSPVEFAVGIERNQVLFGLLRKLESWDAVSGRPLLRMQLPLLPPPRVVGPAYGFLWVTRPGTDDIVVCRLSDGRPFRHQIGAPILEVVYHAASPLLILVTPRGLVRLHCFAHSLTVIDAPWQPGTDLAQLVVGDDISLLGLAEHDDEPWRVPIGGAGAPAITLDSSDGSGEPVVTAADKLRAMRERTGQESRDRADPDRGVPGERTERAERGYPSDRGDPGSRGAAAALPDRDAPGTPNDRGAPDRSERSDRFPSDRGYPSDRAVPSARDDRPGFSGDRADRSARGDRTDRGYPSDAADPSARGDRTDGGYPSDRAAPSARGDRPDRGPASDRAVPSARGDRPDRGYPSDATEPSARGDRAERGEAPARLMLGGTGPRTAGAPRTRTWRDPLAAFGAELARGAADEAELPVVAAETELGVLAQRLALPAGARRALVALYSAYLIGEPGLALARLAHALGDWTEALGQGELAALAMLRRRGGRIGLRA
ncbi:MAG TPA: hypothetical protein VK601_24130, partial [Kofleriaceae bacterium]|nr:hypothetical protein [Kofleriaceae bacterium]